MNIFIEREKNKSSSFLLKKQTRNLNKCEFRTNERISEDNDLFFLGTCEDSKSCRINETVDFAQNTRTSIGSRCTKEGCCTVNRETRALTVTTARLCIHFPRPGPLYARIRSAGRPVLKSPIFPRATVPRFARCVISTPQDSGIPICEIVANVLFWNSVVHAIPPFTVTCRSTCL